MQVTLNIADDMAESLRAAHGDDLRRAALERLALDGDAILDASLERHGRTKEAEASPNS